jgi:tetratricopeptide (TPR) repeat protein
MTTAVVVLLFPYAASVYHLEAGGRALDEALGEIDPLEWWYLGPREVRDSQALQKAIAHLQKAGSLSHAWRLLGRAWVAQEEFLKGIKALEKFTASHPDNPIGHLELAVAYELIDRRLKELEYLRLLDVLPEAQISVPDLEGQVHYRPESWASDYAYPTAFSLPANSEERPTLFLHAGSRVTYTVALTQPAVLRFGMGLDPGSLDWGGDGATFEVFVDGARIFLAHLPVEVAREGWQEREVDLADYVGQTVRLALVTTPGPRGDDTADWAGWADPRIEAPEAMAHWLVVKDEPWLAEWNKAGLRAKDLILAGEEARKAEQYHDALIWYEWAMRVEADQGDPWYYVGQLYEDQQRWLLAMSAYERAIALGRFQIVHRSSPHYRLGIIYQWQLDPRQIEKALAAYDAALDADNFNDNSEASACHYGRGEILRWQKADPDEYVAEFQRAISLNPNHVWAHILLGLALYEQNKDVSAAEAALLKAIELAPQSKWAYYHLGEIYRQEGIKDKAVAMYKQALGLDPGFEAAQKWVATLESEP